MISTLDKNIGHSMEFKTEYKNAYFYIRIFSNSKRIHQLVQNFSDFKEVSEYEPRLKVDFYLEEVLEEGLDENDSYMYSGCRDKDKKYSFFGQKLIHVENDLDQNISRVKIFKYDEKYKERLLDFIFSCQLRFHLEKHSFYSLHASFVSKGGHGVLIAGDQNCGKSTLAYTFMKKGYEYLADDDCYVKTMPSFTGVLPLPSKMGIKDSTLDIYPELKRYVINDFSYGGKKRAAPSSLANHIGDQAYPCQTIIFPVYSPDSEIQFRKISKEITLKKLIDVYLSISEYKKASAGVFWTFKELCSETNAYILKYNDQCLDDVVESFERKVAIY